MENQWKKRLQMPISVYVWTVLIIIRFGILNFIGYFSVFRNAEGEVYLPIVVVSFSLCLFTAAAAIWALTSENSGRIALMILVPLNILWVILLVLPALFNNEKEDDANAVTSIVQMVILSIIIVGFEWNFMSKNVVDYYKQND